MTNAACGLDPAVRAEAFADAAASSPAGASTDAADPASTTRPPRDPRSTTFSTFVAVGAGDTAQTDDAALPVAEAQDAVPVLHAAAIGAVLATPGAMVAALASALGLLAVLAALLGDAAAETWAAIATVSVAALALASRRMRAASSGQPTPRGLQVAAGATASVLLVCAAAPWALRGAGTAPGPALVALVVGVLAVGAGAALAPLRNWAMAWSALPLTVTAAAVAATPPTAEDMQVAAFAVIAAAVAAATAIVQHRRWVNAARLVLTHERHARALEAARDAATRADHEKSRFLAIASHDLRQPVHAIGLFAATLEKRLEGSTDAPLVRNLIRAIDGLDRSFNVMLDISRLDAGAIEPRVQHFPLRDLFRRLHMHFAGQAEQKRLGLRFSPGGKSISSDPQLLERVLGNLVQNAIKYTDEGGIVVVARSTATHINVEVWDTGVGMRAADLPRVFDEFFQVGRGDRVRAQGLGMGLAIVKRLARLLGHGLTVSSRPGRGTMFRLAIPRGALPGIEDATAAADTLPMPLLQPRTVLVVDDEESIREGLCLLLNEWGYESIAAGSIQEAERAVGRLETPPDLILSDLHLGDGADGIAAIAAIRARCGFDVPAMLITGDTTPEEAARAAASGHRVLWKPVQPRKLYDALRGLAA
jgi:two-component system, sensor histidine kinase